MEKEIQISANQSTLFFTMAFNFLSTLSLLSCLLLFTSSFQTPSVNSVPSPPPSSDKVRVGIYYQSIGNADFMSQYVPLMFENGLISIVDLHLVPWGNSKINKNGTIVCQDGERECILNILEACAIHTWPDVGKHFSFIACVEDFVYNKKISEWMICLDHLKLNVAPVWDCFESGLGEELEKKYAEETAALKPPHDYTPWVVVNGKHIDGFEKTMTYICKAYKGSSIPEVCKHLPISTSVSIKSRKVQKVSYRKNDAEVKKFTRWKMIIA